jgi:ferrochelatase
MDDVAHSGYHHVLVAPIGFLCDHVETLYDIDIELTQLARSKGIQLKRIPMLNASAPLIDILTSVVEAHESSLVH